MGDPMRALCLALALIMATAPFARADDAADVAAAQKLFDNGRHLYDLGKFAEALDQFEKAYDLYRAPEFLFNIGQCYRNLKQWEKGIFVFESYLRDKPKTDKRALVEGFIAEMKAALADDQAKAAADAKAKEQLDATQKEQELELERRKKEQQLALDRQRQEQELALERQQEEARIQAAARGTPIYKKWWFWTIAGGVAVAATGGIVWGTRSGMLPSGTLGTIDGR
jgi:tetratricopeptide (TPR) repeat protein